MKMLSDLGPMVLCGLSLRTGSKWSYKHINYNIKTEKKNGLTKQKKGGGHTTGTNTGPTGQTGPGAAGRHIM